MSPRQCGAKDNPLFIPQWEHLQIVIHFDCLFALYNGNVILPEINGPCVICVHVNGKNIDLSEHIIF